MRQNLIFYQLINIFIFFILNLNANDIVILPYIDNQAALSFIQQYFPDKNPIIVEAGAFDGTDTLRMIEKFPDAIIHAFEPLPEGFELLKKNTKNYKNIRLYKLALGNKNGISKFYTSEKSGKIWPSGSLLKPKEHVIVMPNIIFNDEIRVNTITLNDWAKKYNIHKIDFLWLDMQGFELFALKSASRLLKTVKIIYTEVEFIELYTGQPLYCDVKKWLEKQGFILIAKDFTDAYETLDGIKCWFGNAIFLKTKK